MSDYGIASNENDTVSIEEEITQLGLQYSLVTEFTSFVAVDSQAVAATGTSDNPPDDGGGGVVEVDDVHSSEKELIKILGTIVDSEGLLKLDVENLTHLEYGNLSVQITNANGQAVGAYRLGSIPEDNIISLQLGQLPSGIYFVSLLSDSQVLDTERFVVQL